MLIYIYTIEIEKRGKKTITVLIKFKNVSVNKVISVFCSELNITFKKNTADCIKILIVQ